MDILNGILGGTAIISAIVLIGWVAFGYADKIHNWMHRRDLNRNVRKDTHIQFTNTVDKLFADIEENSKITDDETIVTLVAMINSAAGSIRSRRLKRKLFDRTLIINQLKNSVRDGIEIDFKINDKTTIKQIIKSLDLKIKVDSKMSAKLLILVAASAFTEQAPVLRYDKELTPLVEAVSKVHKMPKKQLLRIFRVK